MRLLKITQDSAAILLFDNPDEIDGIYTDDLKSCVAILVTGERGIALIHDSGKLSGQSIAAIFRSVSPIKTWSIAHYPGSDEEQQMLHGAAYKVMYGEKGIFATKYERICRELQLHFDEEIERKYVSPEGKKHFEVNNNLFLSNVTVQSIPTRPFWIVIYFHSIA